MNAVRLFVPDSHGDEITVPEVVELYLAWLRGRVEVDDYDARGLIDVARDLRRFAAVHLMPVSNCRQHDLTSWLDANPQWKAGSTKKRIIATLIGCFNWAADEELIDRRPYRSVQSVSRIPYKPRRPADPAEYVTLMRFGSRAMRRALFALRRLGLRTCEMRGLIWTDCFLDCESPHILAGKHKTRRRTGKPRMIGLDDATASFLRALRRQKTNKHVFNNCDGNPWTKDTFGQHLRRLASRLGLDDGVDERVTGACFRHSYTVDGIEGGVSNRKIADQLGHASTGMVDAVYGIHTRQREGHLANVAEEILRCRKRNR